MSSATNVRCYVDFVEEPPVVAPALGICGAVSEADSCLFALFGEDGRREWNELRFARRRRRWSGPDEEPTTTVLPRCLELNGSWGCLLASEIHDGVRSGSGLASSLIGACSRPSPIIRSVSAGDRRNEPTSGLISSGWGDRGHVTGSRHFPVDPIGVRPMQGWGCRPA